MKSKNLKKWRLRRFLILVLIIGVLTFIHTGINTNIDRFSNNDFSNDLSRDGLQTQDLDASNKYTGIGEAWNVTHWANRTDYNLAASFTNGTSDVLEMPLGLNWEGYQLESSIFNLYDTRNWNNGTFDFGPDDGTYAAGENDTPDIVNPYQNWTFSAIDLQTIDSNTNYNNDMSGNYFSNLNGRSALELRMDGDNVSYGSSWNGYDNGDRCSWNSSFVIDRGEVIDSELRFEVNPYHLANFNSWELVFRLNNIRIYSIGIYSLKVYGASEWHSFNIPQSIWINSSNVYTSPINDTVMAISISLEYNSATARYSSGFQNIAYQQLFIANVELITTAKVKPSQIQLKINDNYVNDVDWGKGTSQISGYWNSSPVTATLSSEDIWALSSFEIELRANLNLFAYKGTPDTTYETNVISLGTKFSTENDSIVKWNCYAHFSVPTGYEETLMRLEFPTDVTITIVNDPQDPSVNILDQCDNSTAGVLTIPVNSISATPDGFWSFEGTSPNYLDQVTILKNSTSIPNNIDWIETNEFLGGDYINITAQINNSPLVSSYITQTMANLQIRFPNGTILSSKTQFKYLDADGNVYFDYFQIPPSPPDYVEGLYQAIITWNNSYSNFGLNESGIMIKNFVVIHNSILTPEQEYYQDNFEDQILNLKVSFQDLVTRNPIRDAFIYTFEFANPFNMLRFSEISPGFYFLEFNLTGADYGNNTLTIFANSTYFVNKILDITIEVINKTDLRVNNDFFDNVQYKQNFTVQIDYIDNTTGLGIDNAELSTDWGGDAHFVPLGNGLYNLTCNASGPGFTAGNLYDFTIYADAYRYESQQIIIRIFITELESKLNLKINGTPVAPNEAYVVEVWQKVNITIEYKDIFDQHLDNANVSIQGAEFSGTLEENILENYYSILLDALEFGQGIDNFLIYAEKPNYKPNSIPFIFIITQRETSYQIFINNENRTHDPSIDVPITSLLNITVKYTDTEGNHISGALIQLSGDYNSNLTEDFILEQYSTIINTAELPVGVRLIQFSAYKPNYELQSTDIRIQVKRIKAEIIPNTESGTSIITIKPGESTTLSITLYDPIFNRTLIGASVTYRWAFGSGEFADPDDDGTYEAVFGNVLDGTYIIAVTVNYGDQYDFETFYLTLTVFRPPEEVLFFQILMSIAIVSAIALAGYLILYWKVLRFPKPIRRVKKFSRTLRSKKAPSVNVILREQAFKEAYRDELGRSSKFIKGKPSNQGIKSDTIIKPDKTPINKRGEADK